MKHHWIVGTILFLLISAATVWSQDASGVMAEAFRVVNIRSGPSTADAVIGQLSPGDTVPVIARNSEEVDWLLIQSDGVTGWVAYFVVSVMGDPLSLPIQTDAEQAAPEPESAGANVIATSDLSMATSPTVTATTFRRANIRTLPDIAAPVLVVLQRGEILEVIGRTNAENDWLQVRTENGVGWIAYFLVAVEGDLEQLPITSRETITPEDAAVETVTVMTRYNANLRVSPSLTSAIIRIVPFNTQVVANARSTSGDWIQVAFNGQQGWILVALVSSEAEINRLAPAE